MEATDQADQYRESAPVSRSRVLTPGGSVRTGRSADIERARSGQAETGGTISKVPAKHGVGWNRCRLRGYKCLFRCPTDVAGKCGDEGVWRRGNRDPKAVPPIIRNYVRCPLRIAGDPKCDPCGPVLQRCKPGSPLRDHGSGALATDLRKDYPPRSICRNWWNPHWRWPLPQGAEQGGQGHCRGSGGLDTGRILAQQRGKQDRRHAVQGRGNWSGQASGHARHGCDRWLPHCQRQGIVAWQGGSPEEGFRRGFRIDHLVALTCARARRSKRWSCDPLRYGTHLSKI